MEWQLLGMLLLGGLLVLMAFGLEVIVAFMVIGIIGAYFLMGGHAGINQVVLSIRDSLGTFSLLPLPLYILMGEVSFQSGIMPRMLDALDKWLGRVPGRLGLLAVGGGTMFATLSGSGMASAAMLASTLTPEMEKRGYAKSMSLGPILGSAGLAIMIPPTGLGVIMASIAQISAGRLFIAIIIPGILMAVLYGAYIFLRCRFQPSVAPAYNVPPTPISEKLLGTVRYILPLGFVIFMVLGLMFLGIATPTESAAMGTLATMILALFSKRLTWKVISQSFRRSVDTTGIVIFILAGAAIFSQVLVFSGIGVGLTKFFVGLPLVPILIIVATQILVLILGCFISTVPIMMITLPIYMPIVYQLGFDPVWFGAIMLLNSEMATTTPPFGTVLFTVKGMAPANTTMQDVYLAALPFLGLDVVVMVLMLIFPQLTLWLPRLML
ncbi:MAG: TRAP transporter large permease subunit [Chloroflexi bacterium]|nr:TRAP transporter large permease subunit [Chloroflexota bacterium]